MFPVLDSNILITNDLAEEAYKSYVRSHKFVKKLSLEGIRNRGGFSMMELDRYLPGWIYNVKFDCKNSKNSNSN